uniref:Anthranilate phosphoribosyltransferase n=1 Tax=Fervidicoccus fontis TaxID=683846 RepID=A0A7J3ZJ17_9CREN
MEYRAILEKVVNRTSLSFDEARELALKIVSGEVTDAIVSAILVGLRMKGESVEEIAGFASAMREAAVKIDGGSAIDVVGTGGDGASTINVSTATALLASTLHPVAKHGNRAVSGRSGSADVLEALGYRIEVGPREAEELLRKTRFVFIFAPLYHPAMKRVMPVRKVLGIRTVFNILGPLTNPASPRRLVVGVFSKSYAKLVAEALTMLGVEKAFVVHGEPGIDEVSPEAVTHVYEVDGSAVEYYTLEPSDFGVKPVPVKSLTALTAEESAIRVLKASKGLDEAVATFVKVNASLALTLTGYARDFRDGAELAGELLPQLIARIEEIVSSNGSITRLRKVIERAGVA